MLARPLDEPPPAPGAPLGGLPEGGFPAGGLPAPAAWVATAVDWLAVAGGPLRLEVMRALVGQQVDETVTRLCARGLCSDGGDMVDVRHPVTRDVAYSSLDSEMRVDMHRRLGEQLSQTPLARGLTAAIVARHLEAGRARQAAADHYLEAGRTAHSSYQVRLAKRYFRRAVRILPENDARCFEAFEALEAICRVQGLRR